MADDVQPDDAAARLLSAATPAIPVWLHRVALDAAAARPGAGHDAQLDGDLRTELEEVVNSVGRATIERLAELLATDVDEQRTTPLSICRDAARAVTAVLHEHGVPPAPGPAPTGRDDDPYHLEPAAWSDIDPSLHEPGLTWGAWKAMTILRRRRDDGLR